MKFSLSSWFCSDDLKFPGTILFHPDFQTHSHGVVYSIFFRMLWLSLSLFLMLQIHGYYYFFPTCSCQRVVFFCWTCKNPKSWFYLPNTLFLFSNSLLFVLSLPILFSYLFQFILFFSYFWMKISLFSESLNFSLLYFDIILYLNMKMKTDTFWRELKSIIFKY